MPEPEAFVRFARRLGPGGLARLRGFGLLHPPQARALMAGFPAVLPLPDWLAALARGGVEDRAAFLQGAEARDDVDDLLCEVCAGEEAPRLLRHALAILGRRWPEAAAIDPTLDPALLRQKIRELRRKLSQTGR
ncbi:MAG: hypothetical protein R3F30_02005 [Planctomycetota bacterium]